jgi:hypothetical protein
MTARDSCTICAAARQHDVEHDGVEIVLLRHPEPIGSVVGDIDGEPFGLQAMTQASGKPSLVLDHKYPHVNSSPPSSSRRDLNPI